MREGGISEGVISGKSFVLDAGALKSGVGCESGGFSHARPDVFL